MLTAHWILFIAGLMPYFIVAIAKAQRGYDNGDPRNPANFVEPLRHRAHGAHQNAFEAFGFLAAAVLLATLRGADAGWVNGLAAAWLALRLVYLWTYLTDRAGLRSIIWFLASFCTIGIFLTALLASPA